MKVEHVKGSATSAKKKQIPLQVQYQLKHVLTLMVLAPAVNEANYCYGRVGGPESNAPQHLPQKFRLLRQFFDACLEYTWIGTGPAYLCGDMTCKLRISPDEHNIITPVKAHTRTARSILGFTHSSGHRASNKTMANQTFSAFLASPAPRASILVSD